MSVFMHVVPDEIDPAVLPDTERGHSIADDERPTLTLVSEGRQKLDISVVIPALNEADNLRFILPLLPSDVTEVILVDGGSTDGTVEVASRIRPDIRVVPQNGKGKGNALACGFEAVTGDVIVMLDADGSADPGEIGRFVKALEGGAQFAKGTRFAQGGGSQDITRFRSMGNRWLTRLVNALFGTRYSDLCYGFNAFKTECLPHLYVDCDGFEVETLINVRLAKAGIKVSEVPSFEHARISGVSNLRAIRDGWRVLRTIVTERARRAPERAGSETPLRRPLMEDLASPNRPKRSSTA